MEHGAHLVSRQPEAHGDLPLWFACLCTLEDALHCGQNSRINTESLLVVLETEGNYSRDESPLLPQSCHGVSCSFDNHVAFEPGEIDKNVTHQAPRGCRRVDALGRRNQCDIHLVQRGHQSLPIVEQSLPPGMRKQEQLTKLRRHATDLG